MPRPLTLAGPRCGLAPAAPDDATHWAAWDSDLAVALPLGDEAYTPTTVEATAQRLREAGARHEHLFTVVTRADAAPIGRCLLFDVDHLNQSAMLGILIGEAAFRGQGYGQEALRLLLDYGVALLNLHAIMLGVFAFNTPAIRCYQRVGFRAIGRRRAARLIAGQRHDVILMDILAAEHQLSAVRPFLPPHAPTAAPA